MREVNFSTPSSNRASVGITTALYDRRALDCTSTLPLINSLNHLCYLTTSSARIREILTIDGGVERLICILKNGRSENMFDVWKWNLAFHCVVNIGVRGSDGKGSDSRGSENIRTRVVEADIVPVIATILDNYNQMVEKTRSQHMDSDVKRSRARIPSFRRRHEEEDGERTLRASSRRDAPPPIAIPPGSFGSSSLAAHVTVDERSTSPRRHGTHRHHRRHVSLPGHMQSAVEEERHQGALRSTPPTDLLSASDNSLLPPMTATSQPETPMTPRQPPAEVSHTTESDSPTRRSTQRRPSVEREVSTSGDSDDGQRSQSRDDAMAEIVGDVSAAAAGPSVLDTLDGQSSIEVETTDDTVTLPIGRPPTDGSIIDSRTTPTSPIRMQPPIVLNNGGVDTPTEADGTNRGLNVIGRERMLGGGVFASAPRDEDVIMSLQLLAYISKYCDLRAYFQQTHLVPRLRIRKSELARMDPLTGRPNHWCASLDEEAEEDNEEDYDNDAEYCQPNDYNIFPLVEKFTVKWHSQEMKYWAGVVMRNLCRKDKSRGDIRQCAYYKCGKWEDYAKQFAKCRRCRQTKYCSKDCQKR